MSGTLSLDQPVKSSSANPNSSNKATVENDGGITTGQKNHKHKSDGEVPSLKFTKVSAIWSPTEYLITETPVIKDISFCFK